MTDKLLYKFVRIPDTDENVIYTDDPVFRVLYNEKVKWQVVKPFSFEWNFEEALGDFPDSNEGNIINNSDFITRVPSIHVELDDAIQIDTSINMLSSALYPAYYFESLYTAVTNVGGFQFLTPYEESITIAHPTIGDFELREIIITYDNGAPEGIDISLPTVGNFTLKDIVITYNNGAPEGIDISLPTVGNFTLYLAVIVYDNGDPEGININHPSIGNFTLA